MSDLANLKAELVELVYDLLSEKRAGELRARIASEPDVAELYAQVLQKASLIAEAARVREGLGARGEGLGGRDKLEVRSEKLSVPTLHTSHSTLLTPHSYINRIMNIAAACLVLLTVCAYAIQRYQLSHIADMSHRDVARAPQSIADFAHKLEATNSPQEAKEPVLDMQHNPGQENDNEATHRAFERASDATENLAGSFSVLNPQAEAEIRSGSYMMRNTQAEAQVQGFPLQSPQLTLQSPQRSRPDLSQQDGMLDTQSEPELPGPLARATMPLRNQSAANQGMYFPENSQAYMPPAMPQRAMPSAAPAMSAPAMPMTPQAMPPQAGAMQPSPVSGMSGGAGMGGSSSFGMPEHDMPQEENKADEQLNVTASAPAESQPETTESIRQNYHFWSVTIGMIVIFCGVALVILSVVLAVLRVASRSRMMVVAVVAGLLCVFVWITLLRG